MLTRLVIGFLAAALCCHIDDMSDAFSIVPIQVGRSVRPSSSSPLFEASLDTKRSGDCAKVQLESTEQNEQPVGPVRAPLKLLGPYIGLGLNFPDLATSSQRSRNVSGIALDFVLDTAANINTLNQQVAQELNLEMVDEAPAGVSASGPISGGATYLLGSCELEGLPEDEQFLFMQNLTASSLPVASPAAAGLLSMAFFHSFDGGVEFDWYGKQTEDGLNLPPSITFYGSSDESSQLRKEMKRVPVRELPVTRLPTVMLNINGVEIPALFDTGSPITVLNSQAAEQAGVKTLSIGSARKHQNDKNPLAGLVNKFQEAQATAQAAARGDILTIAGTSGERIDLVKTESPVVVKLLSEKDEESVGEESIDFGNRHIYVGNIPGLAALNGLGDDSPPAAVLGMDIIRSKSKMLLIAGKKEVYF